MTSALAVLLPLTCFPPEQQPGAKEMLRLTVTPAKEENILYEPVVFRIVLENAGEKPIVIAPDWNRQRGLKVSLARQAAAEGGLEGRVPQDTEFRGFPFSVGISDGPPPGTRVFQPGDRLEHVEAILWNWHERAYFMESPGRLWIKARFRYSREPDRFVESAPVAVGFRPVPRREREPSESWKAPEVASMVQYGAIAGNPQYRTTRERVEAAEHAKQDLGKFVTKHPDSVYAFYAELALRKPAQWADVAFEGLQLLGPGESPDLSLVDRTERHLARARMLFPDDDRLGVEVTYEFPEYTGFKEVLKVISAQSGVSLRLAPELESKTLLSVRQEVPLRQFMKLLEGVPGSGQVWVEDGDGYRLITEEEAAKLNNQRGRQGVDARRRDVPHLPERRSRESTRQVLAGLDQPLSLAFLGLLAAAAIVVVSYVRYRAH
jgi:hypothetical protein